MNVVNFPPPYQNSVTSAHLFSHQAINKPSQDSQETLFKPVEDINQGAHSHTLRRSTHRDSVDRVDPAEQSVKQAAAKQQIDDKVQQAQLNQEQVQIQKLAARDREVRNHERAHAAVGGQYAGAPRYQYQRGPDGVNYAVAGQVSIDTSAIPGDPQATIEKAQVIRRAALAPAEPSGQDRRVAAMATQMEAEARAELSTQQQDARLDDQSESVSEPAAGSEGDQSLARQVQSGPPDEHAESAQSRSFADQFNQRLANTGASLQAHSTGQIISQLV